MVESDDCQSTIAFDRNFFKLLRRLLSFYCAILIMKKSIMRRQINYADISKAAQTRLLEVGLYWSKLITDQFKVNFFGGSSSVNPIEVRRFLIKKVRFPVFKRLAI